MAKLSIQAGATSVSLLLFIQNSSSTTGAGLTALAYNTASLTAYYCIPGSADTSITLATLASASASWATGGFVQVDATNMPGVYRLDIPNAAIASGRSVVVYLQGATNMAPCVLEIELTAINNQSTGFGLVNASANVAQWNGTNVATPATAGIPDINLKNIAGSAVSTSTAQLGVNLVNISGSAVSTTTAQLGVNAVQWAGGAIPAPNVTGVPLVDVKYTLGTLSPAAAGYVGVDWGQITNKTTANALTSTTISSTQVVASVSGAVGSVTGAVGSVTGAVGSVTGAVGSVTGNVGGNVAGSVGSVTGAVGSVTGNVGGNIVGSVASVTAQVTANTTSWGGTSVGAIPPDVVFIRSGTAQTGGSSTITLDSGASSTNNLYNNCVVFIRSGTGAGQSNIITGYVGSTKVATVGSAWATNPASDSVFTIAAFGPVQASVSGTVNANVTEWNGSAVATPNVAGVPKVDLVDISGSAVSTSAAQLGVNAVNIAGQAAALDANNLLKVDVEDINGNATAAQALKNSTNSIIWGTCSGGSLTTAVASAISNPSSLTDANQLVGRTLIFLGTTTTADLQGQASNITASTTGSTPTITYTAMTHAPAAGDTFVIL